MSFGRIALIIGAIAFAAFGIAFFLWPVTLAGPVDIVLPTATARTEFRTVYGGLELGLAAFLAWCAASPARTTIGLLATTSCLAGMVVARVLGAVMDGELAGMTLVNLAIEFTSAVVAAAAWRSESSPALRSATA